MGGRSRAAAQLLAGKGFKEVYNLKGGLKAWKGLKAFGPYEAGLEEITGKEAAEEVIVLAYGMEEGLRDFYDHMAQSVSNNEVQKLFKKLAEIEVAHKNHLFSLYVQLSGQDIDQNSFEDKIDRETMEGGFTTEQFLKENQDLLQTPEDIISLAMMLETQALDLYLRYSRRMEGQTSRDVLYELSEQEKKHIQILGKLLEKPGSSS